MAGQIRQWKIKYHFNRKARSLTSGLFIYSFSGSEFNIQSHHEMHTGHREVIIFGNGAAA